MSGRLCDAVLDRTGSDAVLESLAHSNLLLVALDRHGEWYRYHHLFRDLLRAELQRREPELVNALHVRAAEWCEAQPHARAGDRPRANGLRRRPGQSAHAAERGREHSPRDAVRLSGVGSRGSRTRTWSSSIPRSRCSAHSSISTPAMRPRRNAGALPRNIHRRRCSSTEARAQQRGSPERILPDGSTLASWRAVLRGFQCRDGIDAMRRDAESAIDGLGAGSGIRCAALVLRGYSFLLGGDADRADPIFAQAVEVGLGTSAGAGVVLALAARGYCALGRGDWTAVESFVEEARSAVQQFGLGDYTESALAYTLAARAALHRGDVERARDEVTRAARLRPLLTYARPAYSVQTLVELARTYLALEDPAGAREVLRQARDILQKRPDLGVLPKEVDELESKLDTMRTGNVGASSLTAAELRLVPFLPTHLTYPQVGARLHLSRNTVKSQAISIYQKLGVSSRDEAIERLHEIGLLET